jgi:hypothetical protein
MDPDDMGIVRRAVFRRLFSIFRVPEASLVIGLLDLARRIVTLFEKPKVHYLEDPVDGAPILVMALWQRDALRPDLQRFLNIAVDLGYYVVAINTAKLRVDSIPRNLGVYVEIPNYGRDFASYKFGFKLLRSRNLAAAPGRVLMANDSIYYSTNGLPELLKQVASTEIRVLGATENFEIQRHLGSFFVSFDGDILQHPRFVRFWQRYRLSDIRPKVIRRGELRLSKMLVRVAGESNFRAIWDISRIAKFSRQKNLQDLSVLFTQSMQGNTHWKKSHLVSLVEAWRNRYQTGLLRTNTGTSVRVSSKDLQTVTALTPVGVFKLLEEKFPHLDSEELMASVMNVTIESLMSTAASGSQIHNSAIVFRTLGMPLVKLDLLYRGAANFADVIRLTSQKIEESEATELSQLLLQRPYGADVFVGWRHAAFSVGLI